MPKQTIFAIRTLEQKRTAFAMLKEITSKWWTTSPAHQVFLLILLLSHHDPLLGWRLPPLPTFPLTRIQQTLIKDLLLSQQQQRQQQELFAVYGPPQASPQVKMLLESGQFQVSGSSCIRNGGIFFFVIVPEHTPTLGLPSSVAFTGPTNTANVDLVVGGSNARAGVKESGKNSPY